MICAGLQLTSLMWLWYLYSFLSLGLGARLLTECAAVRTFLLVALLAFGAHYARCFMHHDKP